MLQQVVSSRKPQGSRVKGHLARGVSGGGVWLARSKRGRENNLGQGVVRRRAADFGQSGCFWEGSRFEVFPEQDRLFARNITCRSASYSALRVEVLWSFELDVQAADRQAK